MLSKKDRQDVTTIVTDVVAAMIKPLLPTIPAVNTGTAQPLTPADSMQYSDPYLQVLEERKIEIIKGGLNCVLVKGRRGVQEINRTQQEINMINDEINNRKNWSTHKRVG